MASKRTLSWHRTRHASQDHLIIISSGHHIIMTTCHRHDNVLIIIPSYHIYETFGTQLEYIWKLGAISKTFGQHFEGIRESRTGAPRMVGKWLDIDMPSEDIGF